MSIILATGATGLLGARLVKLAADRGHEVHTIVRGGAGSDAANIRWIEADLAQPLDPSLLPSKVDAVFHLAQSRRFREFPDGAADMFAVNVARTAELFDYAREAGARHFVLASTGSVYAPSNQPLREDSPLLEAPGFYPASKLAAELLARPYAGLMTVAILRFFFIYGASQRGDMLLPRLVSSVREGTPIRLQGADGLRLNPIHADDAAAATLAAAELEESATINVAGPEVSSLRALSELIGAQLGGQPVFETEGGVAASLVADIVRMRELLVEPRVGLGQGIGDLL
jgi:nucleoside-diphosphate-sugar epimerase